MKTRYQQHEMKEDAKEEHKLMCVVDGEERLPLGARACALSLDSESLPSFGQRQEHLLSQCLRILVIRQAQLIKASLHMRAHRETTRKQQPRMSR